MARKKEERKCSFRMPQIGVSESPYGYRVYLVHCDCGTTLLGDSEKKVRESWAHHVEGKI